jgi:hypothetical protein
MTGAAVLVENLHVQFRDVQALAGMARSSAASATAPSFPRA